MFSTRPKFRAMQGTQDGGAVIECEGGRSCAIVPVLFMVVGLCLAS